MDDSASSTSSSTSPPLRHHFDNTHPNDNDDDGNNNQDDDLDLEEDEGWNDEKEEDDEETKKANRAEHALNQKRLHAEILGVRIRLEKLVKRVCVSETPGKSEVVEGIRSMLGNLLVVRKELFEHGQFSALAQSPQVTWESIHSVDSDLWNRHREIVDKWERRLHLSADKGKQLRAFSKGVFDQVEAVLARRRDLNATASFVKEDEPFYDLLLKDFISSMEAKEYAKGDVLKKRKKVKKPNVNVKASKGRRIRHVVHEKLVDFFPPVDMPPCKVDVDRLIKSLFA